MTTRVTELPQGLREDTNLDNGIYVGNLHTDFIVQCSLKLEDSDHVLGSCKDEKPTSVFIDDQKGDVYVPAGKNAWLKFMESDGIKRYHSWAKRNRFWNDARSENTGTWLKYVWRGRESLTTEEIETLLRINAFVQDDLYSYILTHRQKFDQEPELLFRAARYWLREWNQSSYVPLALTIVEQSIRQSKVETESIESFLNQRYFFSENTKNRFSLALIESLKTADGQRLVSLGEMAYQTADEKGKEEVLNLLRQKARDESEEPEIRLTAVKVLDAPRADSDSERREIFSLLFPLIQDWNGGTEGLLEAGNYAFAWLKSLEGAKEALFDVFYERALTDSDPEYRFKAWEFILAGYPEYKEEAQSQLFAMARGKGKINDSLRLEITRSLASRDDNGVDQNKLTEIIIDFVNDRGVTADLRLSALGDILSKVHFSMTEEERAKRVQEALTSLVPLLEREALDKMLRNRLAGYLFREGKSKELYSKGLSYLLKEGGLKNILDELNPKFGGSDFSPKEGIERAQWLLTQYNDSSEHDYPRNSIHWTIKQLREKLPKEPPEGRGQMIVKLSQ